jgi:hypothetical protein
MNKELKTTVWLDLLTYLLLPFVILFGIIEIVRGLLYGVFSLGFMGYLILELAIIGFYVYTFYHARKRNKQAFNLFRILIVISAVRAGLDYATTQNANNGHNFILILIAYLVIAGIAWVYPNEIYFKKRKDLFINDDKLKFTEKCEKCKRIYSKGKKCPKCDK